jgi:hypothetical protein
MSQILPAIFFGHGNPMNAVRDNTYTGGWRQIGKQMDRPKAILAISTHWFVPEPWSQYGFNHDMALSHQSGRICDFPNTVSRYGSSGSQWRSSTSVTSGSAVASFEHVICSPPTSRKVSATSFASAVERVEALS